MQRTPSRRLGALVGLGALLLLLPLAAQGRPGGEDPPRPAPGGQQDAEALRRAEADLQAKRADLQALEQRLRAELELRRAELRTAEDRLKQVQQQLERLVLRGELRPQGAAPGNFEQRLQQLEMKVDLLLKGMDALRQQAAGPRAVGKNFAPLDLQPKANQKRSDVFHSGRYPGNTLTSLPGGLQTLLGVPFQIGESVVQLGSNSIQDKPEKVTGIPVGRKCARLYILHATGYYLDEGQEAPIGSYTIHYEDGTSATIPIVYGKDVMDWWKYPGAGDPSRSKVAWEGVNEANKEFDATLRLYLTTWDNPHPDKRVTSIDYASTMDSPCAPFCVAITAQGP
jgi:hypothetical protein